MLVTKCDICEKEVRGEVVLAGVGHHFSTQSFCTKCGKPILTFLDKLKENKNGKRKKK